MMGGGKKKDSQQSNRYYSPWYSPSQQTQENPNEFRVDADVEHNRLLLWANEVELTEVENLLVKLGEMPAKGDATTRRIIDTPGIEAAQELLDRIRLAWPQVAPNPLEVPSTAAEKPKSAAPPEKSPAEPAAPATSRSTGVERQPSLVRLAQLGPGQSAQVKPERPADAPQTEPEQPADVPRAKPARPVNPAKSPAPLKVTIGPEGRLIVSCEDPQALDLFEEMVTQMAPARKNYKVFQLKYAWAYGVALNLQEFFKEDEKKSNRFSPFFFDYGYGQEDTQERTRLSKRRPLKFISDPDTNTILVEGADAAQLKTIDELIKLYDQAAPTDSQSVRKTETFHLKHSKAKVVAETVKEVYRDLLSANDKALVGNKQTERESGRSFFYVFGDGDKSEQKTPKFKGLLSIGVDELSNTLVVSAPAFLFEQVRTMIEDLDKAAAPTTAVQVVRVGQGVSAEHVQEVLSDLLGTGSPNRRRAAPPPRRPQQPQQQFQGRGGQARQGNTQGNTQQPANNNQGR
jgi:type II secretory pathway component GspD/PulD (secretin)